MSSSWIDKLERMRTTEQSNPSSSQLNHLAEAENQADKFLKLREQIHRDVIDEYNRHAGEGDHNKTEMMEIIRQALAKQNQALTRIEESKLIQQVYDEVMGLGPLEPLLRDETVSEIMVNGPNHIFVERGGRLELTGTKFTDNNHVLKVINRIVAPLGRRCDESSPMVDARLPDGSRVNAIIPPISLIGPVITIRKFSTKPLKIGDLIGFNSLSNPMAHFLDACVKARCNIVVSGGTGSGKTTLLNVLSNFIYDDERIVTIEDAAELQLAQKHVISLESRPVNVEGKGTIAIRDLVRNALRMRPDRIIVGEVRSAETLDMLQAMNTGHEGSLTTVHSNTARDALSRMETMVMFSGMELPIRAIREQISSAIDLVVHQTRFRDGSRKIVNISEIVGMEGDMITMQDLFTYEMNGYDQLGKITGRFKAAGITPRLTEKIRQAGVLCKDEWFRKD